MRVCLRACVYVYGRRTTCRNLYFQFLGLSNQIQIIGLGGSGKQLYRMNYLRNLLWEF